jgi:Na+/H+ antiporter NhaA
MTGLALLGGVGFTVSLLIGELAFGIGSGQDDHAKVAVLLGSLLAAVLAGIGFTVSLLIGELAFGIGGERDGHVKIAVLTGSLVAALLAAGVLRMRNRTYRLLHEAEQADRDGDEIPDVYQHAVRTREEPGPG